MIRKSAFVAALAIVLSLGLHFLGLTFTAPNLTHQPSDPQRSGSVELTTAFEDFADPVPEPDEPEPATQPDPPPEPERTETPTSDAKVASPDPQRVYAPDTGASAIIRPNAQEPDVTESDEPSEKSEQAAAEPPEPTRPVQAPTESPASAQPTVEPPLPTVSAEQDASAAEESDLAVTASIRPRLPEQRPAPPKSETSDEPQDEFAIFRNPKNTVVSPLAQYQRDGTDAFSTRNSASRAGGRGPGNSDETNYAGEVLVHLNRAPIVYVAASGFAQIFFEINPDGTLAWVDVVDSSGSPEVDRAAKEQVRSAAPFPRPPGGVSRKLSFFYRIN